MVKQDSSGFIYCGGDFTKYNDYIANRFVKLSSNGTIKDCTIIPAPTQTPTITQTKTPTQTPTNTATPTLTPTNLIYSWIAFSYSQDCNTFFGTIQIKTKNIVIPDNWYCDNLSNRKYKINNFVGNVNTGTNTDLVMSGTSLTCSGAKC